MNRARRLLREVAFAAAVALSVSAPAEAQGGLLLQGIADLEGWFTDTGSTLLTRNHGKAGTVFRVHLWSAVEPWRGLFLFGQGQAEGGTARAGGDRRTDVALVQGGVRLARDERFVVNVGKMNHPVGAFAPRLFSTRNPLIAAPDGYLPVYPLGAMVSGEIGRIDYKGAAVSLPLTHRGYVPDADAAFRPVIGAGVTPLIGLHIGATGTIGPYLNKDLTSSQLAGQSWQSYRMRQLAADIEWGFAHVDFRGEYATADFEIPGAGRSGGYTYYGEGRYTVSPRVFVAARYEVNNYPFIRASTPPAPWRPRRTDLFSQEAGVGFRVTESTLVKASYRRDHWKVTLANAAFVRPGGHAFAIQLSQSFDVMDWVSAIR